MSTQITKDELEKMTSFINSINLNKDVINYDVNDFNQYMAIYKKDDFIDGIEQDAIDFMNKAVHSLIEKVQDAIISYDDSLNNYKDVLTLVGIIAFLAVIIGLGVALLFSNPLFGLQVGILSLAVGIFCLIGANMLTTQSALDKNISFITNVVNQLPYSPDSVLAKINTISNNTMEEWNRLCKTPGNPVYAVKQEISESKFTI